jgi:hypothetical protein
MLALSLEQLKKHAASDLDVRIFLDNTTEDVLREVVFVRDTYFPEATISHAPPHIQVPSGMWNILNALKQGYETSAEYVFLIEEDILIYPDYFTWHYQAQNSGDYLASCGRKLARLPKYDQYQNPGSCFKREKLGLIVPHINEELFLNREAYYEKHFGRMDEVSTLDDGLVRRIAKHGGYRVIYPEVPKCAHIGFQAYNRYTGWANEGNIEQRIAGLRRMLPTVSPSNRYTGDFEPFNFGAQCHAAAQARLNALASEHAFCGKQSQT